MLFYLLLVSFLNLYQTTISKCSISTDFSGLSSQFVTISVPIVIPSGSTTVIPLCLATSGGFNCASFSSLIFSQTHNNNLSHSILNLISVLLFPCSCPLPACQSNQKNQSRNHSFYSAWHISTCIWETQF